MKHARPPAVATQGGFTIIESVIAMVMLAIASVAIIALQRGIFSGQSDGKSMEVGVQLMQECAEKILGVRRGAGGYAAAITTPCNTGTLGGFASCATVAPLVGAAGTACPGPTILCSTVTISVSTNSCSGPAMNPVTLILVNY